MAQKVVEAFPDLPDDAAVNLKQINEESIHHTMPLRRDCHHGRATAELSSSKA